MTPDFITILEADGPPRGGVVLLQEAFGVNQHLLDVGRRLAAAGWTTAIPHLYHRSGSPTFAYDVAYGDGVDGRDPAAEQAAAQEIGPHALQLTGQTVADDLDSAIEELGRRGFVPSNVGAVGFCFGGSVALYAAAARPLGASIVFYGAAISTPHFGVPAFVDIAAERRTPLLALYGELDQWVSASDVAVLREAIQKGQGPGELIVYPGAEHGFNCDLRTTYHAASATDAWQRTLDWLERYAGA
jgi:carboxymethylenebutenolidase